MKLIFDQGSFNAYRTFRLDEARSSIPDPYYSYQSKTTVFISHKHDELEDLQGLIGFLESNYNVKAYIDSRDPSLPRITSAATAQTIKQRIEKCDRFILLATNGAIESKWCNWELGFGDAKKYKNKIALFLMKPASSSEYLYKGREYMKIYPYISYFDGSEKYSDGSPISAGYYVRTEEENTNYIEPLSKWLKK